MEGAALHPSCLFLLRLLGVAGGAESLAVGHVVGSTFGHGDDVVGFCAGLLSACSAHWVSGEDLRPDGCGEAVAGTGPGRGGTWGLLHGWPPVRVRGVFDLLPVRGWVASHRGGCCGLLGAVGDGSVVPLS